MGDRDWLTQKFEDSRPHLRAVAYRMLSSRSDSLICAVRRRLPRAGESEISTSI